MKVSVGDIIESPGRRKTIEQDENIHLEELNVLAPIHVKLCLMSTGDGGISLEGKINAKVELACSRCAVLYPENLEIDIDELFLPQNSPELKAKSNGEEIDAEGLCVFAYDGELLDLDEVFRQNILASLPFRPLCREDCLGICGGCGVDLNNGSCQCSYEQETDPRWDALKKLIENKD